jgi:hypothetical protein
MSRKVKIALLITIGIPVVLILFIIGLVDIAGVEYLVNEMPKYNQVKAGMSREQTIKLLGTPIESYTAAQSPKDFAKTDWGGYQAPEREISGEVLIYSSGDIVVYVFLDPQGKVEEFRTGSS